jgi:hypothetical protein
MNKYLVISTDLTGLHVSDRILRVLKESQTMAVVFPVHTTHFFWALDLVLFDAIKSIKKTSRGDFGDDSVPCHITKLLQTHDQVATSFIIRNAFRKARLTPELTVRLFRLDFNENVLRANQGFSEIYNLSIAISQLSKWQHSNQFAFINIDFSAGDSDE